jgi:hypothetical protein
VKAHGVVRDGLTKSEYEDAKADQYARLRESAPRGADSWATAFIESPEAREGDLMILGGWRSRTMVDRYTKGGLLREPLNRLGA